MNEGELFSHCLNRTSYIEFDYGILFTLQDGTSYSHGYADVIVAVCYLLYFFIPYSSVYSSAPNLQYRNLAPDTILYTPRSVLENYRDIC